MRRIADSRIQMAGDAPQRAHDEQSEFLEQ